MGANVTRDGCARTSRRRLTRNRGGTGEGRDSDGTREAAEGQRRISLKGPVARRVGSTGLGCVDSPGRRARAGAAASHRATWERRVLATAVAPRRLLRLGDLRLTLPRS
ncbi:uncharacterized protein LOC119468477 [Cebus imitator]|uniref:uncharacterized protein LOC119468477 n=1 Tax=Cebus imitator TaxID=2715852 RepID=UPI00189B5AD7|nr:uncharacterized protein LOC119468477 [Cebus imitator]